MAEHKWDPLGLFHPEINGITSPYLGVSKNNGTPKWMVKIRENPIKMDDLGSFSPYFWKHPLITGFWAHLVGNPYTPPKTNDWHLKMGGNPAKRRFFGNHHFLVGG